jgi:ribosome-binding factor A
MDEKSYQRNARLEGELRATLTELLQREVKDPRLADVTVSAIRLSADRSRARVFFSVIGDSDRELLAKNGFDAAGSFLRRELGRRMRLRVVPTLDFERDTSFEYGDRIERVFDRLHQEGVIPEDDDGTDASDGEQE